MQIIKPPHSLSDIQSKFSIYLAGAREMGMAENCQ